jgi:hypothetical protein
MIDRFTPTVFTSSETWGDKYAVYLTISFPSRVAEKVCEFISEIPFFLINFSLIRLTEVVLHRLAKWADAPEVIYMVEINDVVRIS